jgi:biopolymer transport protein ExbD
MKLARPSAHKARIEMVPLIDTMFLMLVVFVYSMLSMAVHHALPVQLPQSTTAPPDKQVLVAVTVTAEGAVFVDKVPVALDALTDALRQAVGDAPDPAVQVFAEDRLTYQTLFQVLDRIRLAGIERIALQAKVEAAP